MPDSSDETVAGERDTVSAPEAFCEGDEGTEDRQPRRSATYGVPNETTQYRRVCRDMTPGLGAEAGGVSISDDVRDTR